MARHGLAQVLDPDATNLPLRTLAENLQLGVLGRNLLPARQRHEALRPTPVAGIDSQRGEVGALVGLAARRRLIGQPQLGRARCADRQHSPPPVGVQAHLPVGEHLAQHRQHLLELLRAIAVEDEDLVAPDDGAGVNIALEIRPAPGVEPIADHGLLPAGKVAPRRAHRAGRGAFGYLPSHP
jgi:hypothetical protein